MKLSRFQCLCAAIFFTISPYTPQHFLDLAKEKPSIDDKIFLLRRLVQSFPLDAASGAARADLVALLEGSNRTEEALREYAKWHSGADITLLDYQLKTGHYADVLRATEHICRQVGDFSQDLKLTELRAQAFLAQGHYGEARAAIERWLEIYSDKSLEGTRWQPDILTMSLLRREIVALEELVGPTGKPLFTASIPDSQRRWSRKRNVPILFYKLIPATAGDEAPEYILSGRRAGAEFFIRRLNGANRGFGYLSRGAFSLRFQGLRTLYIKNDEMGSEVSEAHLLTSRLYLHTLPEFYRLAEHSFVVLVDYRKQANKEAAYMGDGLIYIPAAKLSTPILMHEILHGLGATHQEWTSLEKHGYRFDPQDRGLMTFGIGGELTELGLEEKNRALLGWPRVQVVPFSEFETTKSPDAPPMRG